MELLRELNRKDGLTVLVTLHQVDYAMRYCDRVVALKAGKIVYDGPTVGPDREPAGRHLWTGDRRRLLGRSAGMIRAARAGLAGRPGAGRCWPAAASPRRPERPSDLTFSILSAEDQAVDAADLAAAAGRHAKARPA